MVRLSSPLLYDTMVYPFEFLFIRRWRRVLWSRLEGSFVLEAGAGTGLNMDFFGKRRQITLLEKEEAALKRARRRAAKKGVQAEFVKGDVENLPFPDESFDAAVATFLFCSVHDPYRGLSELYRVLRKGGQLCLLEHVRSAGGLGKIMDAFSLPLYRLFGEYIARDTDEEVRRSGFENLTVTPLLVDVVKLIQAEKPACGS